MKRLYLDIHALQVLPPSCVNRDDTNTPKSCVYGGKIRSRVSSQCWKRAARMYMKENELETIGLRTKKFKTCVANELINEYSFSDEDAEKAAEICVKVSGVASEKEDAKAVIAFFSEAEIKAFAKVIYENKDIASDAKKSGELKKQLINAVKENPSTDILLFGRMFASEPSLDYDAACQVAHAFSVNEARTEYDYFTAVDDIPNVSDNGSAYLDTKQFADPILYRYANVNLSETSELIRLDKDNAARIAKNFTKSFLLSMPTGSMNGYANATLPDFVVITLRDDMPVSFAPAFIKTVQSDDFMEEAEYKLVTYAEKISNRYGAPILKLSLKDNSLEEIMNIVEKEIGARL